MSVLVIFSSLAVENEDLGTALINPTSSQPWPVPSKEAVKYHMTRCVNDRREAVLGWARNHEPLGCIRERDAPEDAGGIHRFQSCEWMPPRFFAPA